MCIIEFYLYVFYVLYSCNDSLIPFMDILPYRYCSTYALFQSLIPRDQKHFCLIYLFMYINYYV